jgi:ectoine hydroxylase-related dioxygenase (phytanoyl-CoA dioxygenase family)
MNTLLVKEPHTPTVTSFHQDITGNPVEGPVVGMRVSLDTETPESGAMQWIRGSHKWGRWFVPYEAGADEEVVGKAAFEGYVDPDHPEREMEPIPDIENHRDEYDIVTTPAEPGDVFLSSLLIIHGAPGNLTDDRRRAFVCRFAGEGATYAVRNDVPFRLGPAEDPGIEHGDRFPDDPRHPAFPRVWPQPSDAVNAA